MNYTKPIIKEIQDLTLLDTNQYRLDNGVPVYELHYPQTAEVIKLDLVFKAGRLYEQHKLAAKVSASLIKEGTNNYDSKTIANILDFYGAYINANSSMDNITISVLCLNKNFEHIAPLVQEIIFQPTFDEDEFKKFKLRAIENLKMQLSKNDVLGYREITEHIFGVNHPYGYNSIQSDYENLTIENVIDHYDNNFTTDNCTLFISGNINSTIRSLINNCLGKNTKLSADIIKDYLNVEIPTKHKIRIKGKQKYQKAIYIGRKLFERSHPDYFGMVILNTVLGGYFSSRLNRRIREKEGLSYGIDSQLDIMSKDGFFYISTEVENQNEEACIKAIYEEMDNLKTELIPNIEIANVKRYLNGQILNSLDGPFKQIKVTQSLVMNDIDPTLFPERIEILNNISQMELQQLAIKYYNQKDLIEVVVAGDLIV